MTGIYSATIISATGFHTPEKSLAKIFLKMQGSDQQHGPEQEAWQFLPGTASTSLLFLPRSLGHLSAIRLRCDYVAGLGIMIDRVSILDRSSSLIYLFNGGRWMMNPGQRELVLGLSGVRRSAVAVPTLARVSLVAATREQLLQNLEKLKDKCRANDSSASVGEIEENPPTTTTTAENGSSGGGGGGGGVRCTVFIEVAGGGLQQRRGNKNLIWIVARSAARIRYLRERFASMILQGKIRALHLRLMRIPAGRRSRAVTGVAANSIVGGPGIIMNNSGISMSMAPRVSIATIKNLMQQQQQQQTMQLNMQLQPHYTATLDEYDGRDELVQQQQNTTSQSGVGRQFSTMSNSGSGGPDGTPRQSSGLAAGAGGGATPRSIMMQQQQQQQQQDLMMMGSSTAGLAARRRKVMAVFVEDIDEQALRRNGLLLLPGQVGANSPQQTQHSPAYSPIHPMIPTATSSITSKRKHAPRISASSSGNLTNRANAAAAGSHLHVGVAAIRGSVGSYLGANLSEMVDHDLTIGEDSTRGLVTPTVR